MSDEIKDVNTLDEEAVEQSVTPLVEEEPAEQEVNDDNQEAIGGEVENKDGNNAVNKDGSKQSSVKKQKKTKKPLTPEQKKKRLIKALIITGSVLVAIAIIISSIAIANVVAVKGLLAAAKNYEKVQYVERTQYVKVDSADDATAGTFYKDTDGYWTFICDGDFKVVQFTDVHIGGGSFSKQTDAWAMNAVATMIRKEQPDLVIITGDIAFPVPYASGSFDNLAPTQIFAEMMESLEVYWTFAFGNHDTEAYSKNTRAQITAWYESRNLEYCLFERGYNAGEKMGYGNNIYKVRNSAGIVTQALVTLDSHSYIDGDYFGAAWKYDNIHKEQVEWYEQEMKKLVAANVAIDPAYNQPVKNLAFFHIPLVEYREAWSEVIEHGLDDNNFVPNASDGRIVEFNYGVMGESDKKKNGQRTYGVFCGLNQDAFFEKGVVNGLQGTFCGHDHYNNFSVNYTKTFTDENGKEITGTVRLTYGMSVDYLAYPGIYKEHSQRGCTVIDISNDGNFDCSPRNYYIDYNVKHEKG